MRCDTQESVTTVADVAPRWNYSGFAVKHQQARFPSRFVALSMVPVLLSLSTAQAAKPIQWKDLGKKIGHGRLGTDGREDREYRVMTKDGAMHADRRLHVFSTGIQLGEAGPMVSRDQVVEIRIHHHRPGLDILLAPAEALFSGVGEGDGSGYDFGPVDPWLLMLVPVALGVDAGCRTYCSAGGSRPANAAEQSRACGALNCRICYAAGLRPVNNANSSHFQWQSTSSKPISRSQCSWVSSASSLLDGSSSCG